MHSNMNYRCRIIIYKIFLIIALIFLIDGCTVIGFTIGSSIDRRTPESESIPYSKWFEVEPGTDIKVISMNGDTSEGEYISADPMSFDKSKDQYRKWYQESGDTLNLQEIDDTVMFKTLNNSYEGRFYGFDFNNVWVKLTGKSAYGVLPLKDIITINDQHNKTITGEDLRNKINLRLVPVSVTISFKMNQDTLSIPAMHIKDIKIKFGRNAKWWGAFIGLPADALLVAVIIFLSNLSFTD